MTTSTPSRSSEVDGMRYSLDSTRILTECCEQSATCRFQLVHCVYSVHATFVAMHEEWIELQMPPNEGESPLIQHAICCISFSYGTSYCAFLGCLIDVRRMVPGELQIVVTFPKQLIVTNLRQSFRVPVVEKSGFETLIRTLKDEEYSVIARDITEGGIEVEFPPGTDPGLTIGSTISVEMRFKGEVVQRAATVRRTVDNRCGVAFVNAQDDNAQRQASRMRGMVLSLQQLWLRSRLK